jgi:hypothetical protein
MLRTEKGSFPNSGTQPHGIGMKNSNHHPIPSPTISGVQLGSSVHSSKLFGEWQQRGPETFSGHVIRKLRLTLALPHSLASASAAR